MTAGFRVLLQYEGPVRNDRIPVSLSGHLPLCFNCLLPAKKRFFWDDIAIFFIFEVDLSGIHLSVKLMTDLLSIVSASDKRRNLLILLNSGPKSWDEIKTALAVTSTGMLPQIKILEEEHLIARDGKKFKLTPMSLVLITYMGPFLKTIELFDKHKQFWQEHDLSVLPDEILLTISDLGNYQILENPDEHIFDINPFLNNITTSKNIKGISHTVHPKFPDFFLSLAKNGVRSSLILTPGVFKIVKHKYHDMLEEWLRIETTELYVSKNDLKFSFVVTDSYFSLSLFFNNGVFDAKHDVVCYDPSARAWGERIFSYYKKHSQKIESLD
ncbi:MAG: winged helix-turn-helix domain-containing protein [Methanoregula sp.]|nr:winged helix-turn-helix domain-containing protein [Methanoregula sp.]